MRGTALATMVGIGLLVYAVAILATGALGLRQLRGFLRRTAARLRLAFAASATR